jgi:hypothetical protein
MTLALYQNYRDALDAMKPPGRRMPYDWGNLPKSVGFQWIAYGLMLPEFSRELANIINRLIDDVPRLEAWSQVVAPLSDEEKMHANIEFIDPLATVALCRPSVIAARFAFAAAHLCHQANRVKRGKAWRDDLRLDRDINMKDAAKAGAGWSKFDDFKLRVDEVNSDAFISATHNFRNVYNHRFSRPFVFGKSWIVGREVDPKTKQVRYTFSIAEPLDLGEMARLLRAECDRCYLAFEAFQALVAEHEAVIAKNP